MRAIQFPVARMIITGHSGGSKISFPIVNHDSIRNTYSHDGFFKCSKLNVRDSL